ncbi:MAG: addiction module toxin RelE [Magnetococcales bacterium]|nr:addiction module toxin RelE [Magnetococcales bacterium]
METKLVTLIELPEFQKMASRYFSDDELTNLKVYLASNPTSGNLMKGTGGLRKLRWVTEGRGKRGGSRVIYYFQDLRFPLLLITVFSKTTKVDLTQDQRVEFRKLIEKIKQNRRKNV